jgi:hypothetical protein
MKLRKTFHPYFGQHKSRSGQAFNIVRKIHPNEYADAKSGPSHVIEFDDRVQIDAWAVEIFETPRLSAVCPRTTI